MLPAFTELSSIELHLDSVRAVGSGHKDMANNKCLWIKRDCKFLIRTACLEYRRHVIVLKESRLSRQQHGRTICHDVLDSGPAGRLSLRACEFKMASIIRQCGKAAVRREYQRASNRFMGHHVHNRAADGV